MHGRDPLSRAGVERLGRYRIKGVIGTGAVGVVYLAEDEVINRAVAVKVLVVDPSFSQSLQEELRIRFSREAQAAGGLSHENIVIIHDVGEDRGFSYITMELLQGQTLFEVISEGPIVWQEAAEIVGEVLEALQYSHEQGIVHRGIKPDNVFLLHDGRIKVTDFGIARVAGRGTLTNIGDIIGTPGYMSPEQVRGNPVGHQTDIFSAGVLLYEMMTGVNPFEADTPTAVIFKTIHGEAPDVVRVDSDVPGAFRPVFTRALAKEPGGRYPSASHMKKDLDRVLSGETVELPVPSSGEPSVSPGFPAVLHVPGKTEEAVKAGAVAPNISGKEHQEGTPAVGQFEAVPAAGGAGVREEVPPAESMSAAAVRYAPVRSANARPYLAGILLAVILLVLLGSGAFLAFYLVRQNTIENQRKHYEAAEAALKKEDFDRAIREYGQAGDYEDAESRITEAEEHKRVSGELSEKYDQVVALMNQGGQWQQAHALLMEMKELNPVYRDTAGKIHYLENCPQNPLRVSLGDVTASGKYDINVTNLIGVPMATINVWRGWSYSNAGRGDLISTVELRLRGESGQAGPHVVLAASGLERYKEGADVFIVPNNGQQFGATAGNWNFNFNVLDISRNPASIAGYASGDQVFSSLVVEFSIGVR